MNLGGAEILVIIVIGIMILGPDKLPSALRMFGKTMGEIKKYQDLAKGEISKAMDSAQASFDSSESTTSQDDPEPEKDKETESKSKPSEKRKSVESEPADIVEPILDEED